MFLNNKNRNPYLSHSCSWQLPGSGKLTSPGGVIDKVGKERNEPSEHWQLGSCLEVWTWLMSPKDSKPSLAKS